MLLNAYTPISSREVLQNAENASVGPAGVHVWGPFGENSCCKESGVSSSSARAVLPRSELLVYLNIKS
jgi:hypothetical protein